MARLLLFFTGLRYYLPVEANNAGAKDNKIFAGLCTGYAPAPLGDDLSRFQRLLREMETGRPDELSRLFSAAVAPMAFGQVRDPDETSASSVYTSMQKDAEEKNSIRYKERLWQARLILKLAEMLDRREAEVKQGLAHLASVEQNVFAALTGINSPESPATEEIPGFEKPRHLKSSDIPPVEPSRESSGQLIPLRLKAWAELYLADSTGQQPFILVTANPESGSLLLDRCEDIWRRNPEKLFSLPIPAVNPADDEGVWDRFLTARNTFHGTAKKDMEYFARFLGKTAAHAVAAPDNQDETARLAENVSAWRDHVQVHFPGPETGRKKLDFYCFPDVSPAELLQRIFHLEKPNFPNKKNYPSAIVATLRS